jgi:RNA recognition motif-containing protein
VFVGNLSFDVSREELIEAFSAAGKVVDAKVPTDRETGRPRGFAFVEFEDDEAAQKSISLMNGKDLKGRPLRVNEAENRPPRPAGGGAPFRPSGPPSGRDVRSHRRCRPMEASTNSAAATAPSRRRGAAATSAAASAGSTRPLALSGRARETRRKKPGAVLRPDASAYHFS